jgi:PAS domain S-box-containing protein
VSVLHKLLSMETTQNQRRRLQTVAVQILLGIAGLALITFVCIQLGFGLARTGFAYVIVISLVSLLGSFSASIVLSIVAAACLNFFFAPPLYEFRIDIPDDIERIATFLTTSLVVTALVTKVKRSADELRENQAKWVKAERVAHFGWWERDFTTNHVSLSDEVSRIFGVRPVDLPDWHERWPELIHPEDRARAAEAAAAALVPGGPRYDVEYRLLRPDGTERVVRSQGDVAWDDSGLPLRQFGVMQDITELRHAEHELRASETRFRTLVDHASDAFFLYNEDATVLDVNRQACENLGYRRDELIGMTAFDYGPDLTPALLQRIRERLRDGKIVTYDGRHRRKDGTVFPVEVRIRPLWREGQLLAVSLDRDITERKRAEDELRASEERFRTFADYAADAFFLFDDHAAILDVNRQACESLGYSREELIGKHPSDFDVGLDEASIERLRQRMLGAETVTFETRHKRKDGTSFPVEVRGGQFQQGGRRYLSLARDITERKQAEEALRRSEAYLAEAQRLSHTGTAVYNASGNLYWSDECYRIWDFDPLQGLPAADTVWQRIHPDDRDRVREENQKALHESGEHSVEFRIFCCDGSIKYIEATFRPLRSPQGDIDEIVCTHVDVTERRRAQAQAEKLRQLEADLAHMNRLGIMGELTASLAHEILHPIATVRNNARAGTRLLEMSPPNLGEVKEMLGYVVRDADRAKDIVGRIRDHIKKAPPQKEIVDLDEAIDEVIVMVRAAMDRNRVSVRTRFMEHRASVRGDRVQLQQVMLNLILNAMEAMSSVGEGTRELSISIEADQAGGILVAVRDSGPGIESEHRNRIFEPFYTTKTSGIGMGLSICRSIIDAHGGRLWADADRPRGAVFRFTLPAADEGSDISSSTCLETYLQPKGVACPKTATLD